MTKQLLFGVGDDHSAVMVWRDGNGGPVVFRSSLSVDADGAPDAYHPAPAEHLGLDNLAYAGHDGDWWALATDRMGKPYVQTTGPYAGFYVSETALFDHTKAESDPARYVDARHVPYISLPGGHPWPVKLGDLAAVYHTRTRRLAYAIYAEVGPHDSIGEGSIALADALGTYRASDPRDARHGGTDSACVISVAFPGTRHVPSWPLPVNVINDQAAGWFNAWGGMSRLDAFFPGIA